MPTVETIRVVTPQPIVTIVGTSTPAATNFSLNASSSSVSLVAGANITLQSNASTITIVGGGGNAFTLNASTGSVSLVAGDNITLQSNASTITIIGGGAADFSLNASTGSVSLVAGNNITLASNASTISIGIALTNAGAFQSFSGGGTSIAASVISVALVGGNNISLASASAAGSLTLTVHGSSNATNNVSSLNGSSGALSVSAGAGIGIGQANSTLTISASNQTSSLSYVAALGTGAATSTGTIVLVAGNNVTLNTGVSSITIVGATPVNFSTISLSASGNTTGATSSGTMNNVLAVSGMGIISVGAGNGTISISATAPGATVSLTALGNTTSSSSGTYSGLLNVSGAGGVSVGAGAQSLTISGPVQSTLVAGANISLTSGAGSITIIGVPNALSLTQIQPLAEIAGTAVSKAGTVTGTAGVGSSLFLQRINVPGKMSLTEIDAAMSIGFPATNQGAGTMSRSMVVYSFGNSTSLATVMSASGTSAWGTGTSTAGASSSLTQFQGGWSSPLIQPFTFASSSLSPGDYVVGQLFNFAQGSSTWTINFYGGQAYSSAGALTSAGLLAGSAFTGTTNITLSSMSIAAGSGITAITQNATNNISWFVSRATSAVTSVASATSSFTFLEAPFVGSLGTIAGSVITASTAATALSNSGLSAFSFRSASTSFSAAALTLPNFGFIGTGSTTSGLPTAFMAGIMSTGAVPTAITLTSTAVTYSGSIAFQQPWFGLVGQ